MSPTLSPRAGRNGPSNGAPPKFYELHVQTLRVGSDLPFALYTRIEGEYLVYRRESLQFGEEQVAALSGNGISTLFVASDQQTRFIAYLTANVDQLVDSDLSIEERAPLFYHSSSELTRHALTFPVVRNSVTTASGVVDSNIRFLNQDASALHSMMSQMGVGEDVYHKALNCCQYGINLARRVGIDDERELESFGLGLLYMDLGMQQLPRSLRGKTGPLSFDEWTVIKRHPGAAQATLEDLSNVPDLARAVVIGHHERLDGTGYPQALVGDEISMALRIAAIVDTFNALTTHGGDRVRSSFEALAEMKTQMLGKFDPDILQAFIEMLCSSPDDS